MSQSWRWCWNVGLRTELLCYLAVSCLIGIPVRGPLPTESVRDPLPPPNGGSRRFAPSFIIPKASIPRASARGSPSRGPCRRAGELNCDAPDQRGNPHDDPVEPRHYRGCPANSETGPRAVRSALRRCRGRIQGQRAQHLNSRSRRHADAAGPPLSSLILIASPSSAFAGVSGPRLACQ